MRSVVLASLLLSLLTAGCADAHGLGSITDAAPIVIDAPLDAWTNHDCPPDLDPHDPNAACSPEGSTCSSGGGACASSMSCTCTGGHWNCAVAEIDPVCTCGRQPSVGDPCVSIATSCGECCPTPGGNGWPAVECVAGHWQSVACPAIACQPVEISCPADTHAWLGTSCTTQGAECGDACCGNAITCDSGTWIGGPEADCFACLSYACGSGLCRTDETCVEQCAPTDADDYTCEPRAMGCDDCSCIPVEDGATCAMIDGHPHVTLISPCR